MQAPSTTERAAHGEDFDSDPIRRVELAAEQNLWACYQCGKCMADCPFSLTPNLVVRLLQLGRLDAARALATTWECAVCYTCATACPKGVSPARLMRALRQMNGGRRPRGVLHASPTIVGTTPSGVLPDGAGAFVLPQLIPRPAVWGWFSDGFHRLRARVLANMPRMYRLGSAFAPASNWLVRVPGMRLMAHVLLGFHRKRPMPRFVREPFPAWFARRTPLGDGHRGPVVFFHDTFLDYSYPQVGVAAVELLEKAGFKVELANNVCCGRPAISKGLTDIAAKAACENVARLYDAASRGSIIVGCEPSCLLSLRDEYPHLVPEEMRAKADVVAKQTMLIDEFFAMLAEKGELELKFKNGERPPILFHGHCHQKAYADANKSVDLLDLAGYETDAINAACCGMAGAYGYEREHYEPSRQAGERVLFPTIRENPEAGVVAMGISCRQQIEHFTGRPVRHLVEALRDVVE
jgi:Fe-S oxidoreductase